MVFAKRIELRDEKLLKRIFDLRNEKNGFNNISKIVSDEFNTSITPPTVKNLYYEYAAKQNIKKETGQTFDNSFNEMLTKKFHRIEKITNSLLDAVETIKKDLTPELYLKHAPTIIAILRESLNQLAFIRSEQKEITIKQQNVVYSPLQIISEINRIEGRKKEKVYVIGNQGSSIKTGGNEMVEDEFEDDLDIVDISDEEEDDD